MDMRAPALTDLVAKTKIRIDLMLFAWVRSQWIHLDPAGPIHLDPVGPIHLGPVGPIHINFTFV